MNEEKLKHKYPFLSPLDIKVLYLIGKSKINYDDIKKLSRDGLELYVKKYQKKIIELNKYSRKADEVNVNNLDVNTLFYIKKQKIPMKKIYDLLLIICNYKISNYPISEKIVKSVRKILLRKKLLNFVVMIFSFGFVLSTLNYILYWNNDSKHTKKIVASVNEKIVDEGIKLKKEDIIVEEQLGDNNKENVKTNYYFKYLNESYLNVNFDDLKKENSDVKGWVKVNGTNINYPFVQTNDNEYYLKHSFDKSKNKNGWVYLDFRNNLDELNQNTILYAHGSVNNTMFGSLRWIFKDKWFNNNSNRIVQISTENANYAWEVFSVYTIEPESYYITTNFDNNEEYKNFLNTIFSRSFHKYKSNLNENDKILTLSSCYNDTKRMVLHAKLIAVSEK